MSEENRRPEPLFACDDDFSLGTLKRRTPIKATAMTILRKKHEAGEELGDLSALIIKAGDTCLHNLDERGKKNPMRASIMRYQFHIRDMPVVSKHLSEITKAVKTLLSEGLTVTFCTKTDCRCQNKAVESTPYGQPSGYRKKPIQSEHSNHMRERVINTTNVHQMSPEKFPRLGFYFSKTPLATY